MKRIFIIIFILCCFASYADERRTAPAGSYSDVKVFIDEMVLKHKLSRSFLQKAFDSFVFDYSVIDLMDRPAEKASSWTVYRNQLASAQRISQGRAYLDTQKAAFDREESVYGVPRHMIAAILGVESNYGTATLRRPSIQSISTLAFEYPRRAAFFRTELENLLIVAARENADPMSYLGSYAGAVGIPQFMPGSIVSYAKDGDGDEKINIVSNHSDAIASVANYISRHGWSAGKNVVAAVKLSKDMDESNFANNPCSDSARKTVAQWKNLGVEVPSGYADSERAILTKLSQEDEEGTFEPVLMFENACPVYRYNPNRKYIAAVSILADELAKGK